MKKKLKKFGTSTSVAEVQNISQHGIWILVDHEEFFLDFLRYPWFRDATISQIYDVQYLYQKHLHWPAIDVDLEVASLKNPAAYPLVYKS